MAKWRLINKRTGKEAGIVDDKDLEITKNHPHTKGKYEFEKIEEPTKPVGVKKAKSAEK